MSMRLLAAAAIGALFSLTGVAASVHAAPPAFCREYANDAVRQNDEAHRSRRCEDATRDAPLRWQSDYRNHYTWCLRVSEEEANRERDIRRRVLEECRGRPHGGY